MRAMPRRRRRIQNRKYTVACWTTRPVPAVAIGLPAQRLAEERGDAADCRATQQRRRSQFERLFCIAAAAESFRARRQSRLVEEGRTGGRRTALWVVPRRHI